MTDPNAYAAIYTNLYQQQSFETIMVQVRRKRVLASLRGYSHRHILEIGCGLEPLFTAWDDYETCTIVEPSEAFVEHARSLAAGQDRIRIYQGHIESVSVNMFGAQAFDFIVLSGLLHEIPDPAAVLRAVHALCQPSTIVHINVPNMYSFHRLLALEMGLIESVYDQSATDIRLGHHTQFDKAHLVAIVEQNGFEVLTSGTYFIKPFTHAQMDQLLASGIVAGPLIEGLERMTTYLPEMGCEMFVDVKRQSSPPSPLSIAQREE